MAALLIFVLLVVPPVLAFRGLLYRGAWAGIGLVFLLLSVLSYAIVSEAGAPPPATKASELVGKRYAEGIISDDDYNDLVVKCGRGVKIVRNGYDYCAAMKDWNAEQKRVAASLAQQKNNAEEKAVVASSVMASAFFGCLLAACFYRKKRDT